MNDHSFKLLSALRPGDAGRVDELFPLELKLGLFEAIAGEIPVAAPKYAVAPAGRRRRWSLALGVIATAAAAAAAAVLATGSAVNPTPADAVSFRTASNGYIVATVTDPFAAQSQLHAAFAKRGLDITVNLVPVSPSIVGTVVFVGESGHGPHIESLQGGHCLTGGGGCPIGIRIPNDFTGAANITLGRQARPGEGYESTASAFAPGEPLHCSGLLGATVASTVPVLARDELTAKWREVVTDRSGLSSHATTVARPPAQGYVWDAELTAPGQLTVTIESTPWPDYPGAGSHYNDGC